MQKCPELRKKYWGQHVWAIGYGCWNTGDITDEMVNEYLEHQRKPDDKGEANFIIEWKERLSVSIKTMVLQVHCG